MSVKLVQYWNIIPTKKAEFDNFFRDQFIATIDQSNAMKMVGSWLVASGEGPYFIAEGVSETVDQMTTLIMGESFINLRRELLKLVEDYSTKLLVPTGRLEPQLTTIQKGFKFNRHFNINAADYYGFYSFMEKEYFPLMDEFKLEMIGDWYVQIGATPYVISEGRSDNLSVISQMLQSQKNQDLMLTLLSMATHYGCKVLVPSGHLNQ